MMEFLFGKKRKTTGMNRIRINGVDIVGGRSITVRGGELRVDGELVEVPGIKGAVEIRVLEGMINDLDTDLSVTCNDVQGDIRAGGSVSCDSVGGDVEAGGSVSCDEVQGNVQAGGSVSCDSVDGDVTAGGSVTCDDVSGDVTADGAVNCDNVGGSVVQVR